MAETSIKLLVKRRMTISRTGSVAQINGQTSLPICVFLVVLLSLFWPSYTASQDQLPVPGQLVGGEFSYVVQKGDSLTSIGARFGAAAADLAAINNLSASATLKIGQQLRIDNRHIVPARVNDGIVINIPQRLLFYFKNGRLVRSFPVGLGRHDWPTPTGPFKIAVKEENPIWDVPKSIQEEMRREGQAVKTCVPPGPDNPLGKHWLGLSIGGYGIHGTTAPASIYHFQTHGCIRAHPDDIAQLFNDVSRGTAGVLVYRRLMIADVGGKIYLEVHRDVYKKQPDVDGQFEELMRTLKLDSQVDRELATDIIRKQDGIARAIGVKRSQ
jgi:L,D-transpeptidase ErfK/SrfK